MNNLHNEQYWIDRFSQLENSRNLMSIDTVYRIQNNLNNAQREIEKEINNWYNRFAINNGVDMQTAKQWLNGKDLKEFKWSVEDYIKYGRENAINQRWLNQLENASAKVHISRLEALKIQCQQQIEKSFGNNTDEIDDLLNKIYTQNYYKSIFEIQKGSQIGFSVQKLDDERVKNILSKPWATDGRNFSERIWASKSQLINQTHNSLTKMCVMGKAPDTAIKEIASAMNTTKSQAGRLVMTESAYFGTLSQQQCFNDLGVEQYEICATLDSKTSTICQEMDSKVFDMKDFNAGVTAPPFHPNCRTCTCPYFDDEFSIEDMRVARDEDGTVYEIPANKNYRDWKEQYVDKTKPITDKETVSVDMDSLKNNLELYVGGGYGSVKEVLEAEEFDFIKANMEETTESLYRIENAEFTLDSKNLKVGDEFGFDDDIRSFTRSKDYAEDLLAMGEDEGIFEEPVVYKTVGKTRHFNMDYYTENYYENQSESLVGGKFKVRSIEEKTINGVQTKVVTIEQCAEEKSTNSILDLKNPVRPKKTDFDLDTDKGATNYMTSMSKYIKDKEIYTEKLDTAVKNATSKQIFNTNDEIRDWGEQIGIRIDDEVLEKIDKKSFNEVKPTLEEMFDKFPEIKSFEIEIDDGSILKTDFKIGLTDDGLLSANGGFNFNERYFSNYEYGVRAAYTSMIDGYLVKGDGTFSTLVRHEYGHNVESYIKFNIAKKYHHSVDDFRLHFKSLDEWKKADDLYWKEYRQFEKELISLANLDGASEYSNVNTLELFAEGFADYTSGGTSDFAKAFGEFLERWYK